jgi:hypothetical protein
MVKKIVGVDGQEFCSIPTVASVRPCGSQVLIEMLTAQELMNTTLKLSDGTDPKVPMQGYVRAVGPSFNEAWGFKVGDRVLISGSGVLAPNASLKSGRDSFLMEPVSVRAVLVEGS